MSIHKQKQANKGKWGLRWGCRRGLRWGQTRTQKRVEVRANRAQEGWGECWLCNCLHHLPLVLALPPSPLHIGHITIMTTTSYQPPHHDHHLYVLASSPQPSSSHTDSEQAWVGPVSMGVGRARHVWAGYHTVYNFLLSLCFFSFLLTNLH